MQLWRLSNKFHPHFVHPSSGHPRPELFFIPPWNPLSFFSPHTVHKPLNFFDELRQQIAELDRMTYRH